MADVEGIKEGVLKIFHNMDLTYKILHDISRISFSFESYLGPKNESNKFKNTIFIGNVNEKVDISGHQAPYSDLLIQNPKLAVIRFAVAFLYLVHVSSQINKMLHSIMDKAFQDIVMQNGVSSESQMA